ncbi:MAG TPA: PASTA domain-containing protein [Thermoanaerobaculia bacterium]|nr:PASTA domain-containing protein [Thermoanaerobaculia bacterium]
MLRKLLHALGFVAYLLLVVVVFILAGYFAFSSFVRSGVIAVPQVTGLSRTDAANLLADRGLALRQVSHPGRYDDKIPIGHVVRQSPDARTFVKRGSGVELVLSLGPRRVEVPNLAGKALPAAQVTLSALGLGVGSILGAFEARRPAGSVLEQDPDPGFSVAPATTVDLLLAMTATGERYLMPDLVYRHYDVVRPFFERRGFRFGSVKFERYEGVAAGVILRQFPLPGHPLTRGDPVSLVVATAEGEP